MKTSAQLHEESRLLRMESALQRNRTGPVAKPNKCSPSCEKSMAQAPKAQQRLKLGRKSKNMEAIVQKAHDSNAEMHHRVLRQTNNCSISPNIQRNRWSSLDLTGSCQSTHSCRFRKRVLCARRARMTHGCTRMTSLNEVRRTRR
jgi:hypothetical protein